MRVFAIAGSLLLVSAFCTLRTRRDVESPTDLDHQRSPRSSAAESKPGSFDYRPTSAARPPSKPTIQSIVLSFRDAETLQPIPGVWVFEGGRTVTQANRSGQATLDPSLLPRAVANVAGYAPRWLGEVENRERVDVFLARGHDVEGRCLDLNGAPIEGVRLTLSHGGASCDGAREVSEGVWLTPHEDIEGARALVLPSTTSASDGRFRLGGVPAGDYTLDVRKAGYVLSSKHSLGAYPVAVPTDDLVVELGRLFATVVVVDRRCSCGQVLDAQGLGVRVVNLGYKTLEVQAPLVAARMKEGLATLVAGEPAKFIDLWVGPNPEDGRVGVPFDIDAPTGKSIRAMPWMVPLDEFGSSDVERVEMRESCSGHGKLTILGPLPIRIRSSGNGGRHGWTPLEPVDGRTEIELPPGKYFAESAIPTNADSGDERKPRWAATVTKGGSTILDLREELGGLRSVELLVFDAGGRPTDRYLVRVVPKHGGKSFTLICEGRAQPSRIDLLPGDYEFVLVDTAGQRRAASDVSVAPGNMALSVQMRF